MTIDNSVGNPGPMGWWIYDTDAPERTLLTERRHWEFMESMAPSRVSRRAAKVVIKAVFDKVKALMDEAGIEDGWSWLLFFEAVLGGLPPWLRQIIGSCVASGGMRALCARTIAEVVLLGEPGETLGTAWTGTNNFNSFAPFNYRVGRRIGGLNGYSDGSFCGAHIQGFMEYGFAPCDLPELRSRTDAFPEPQSGRKYQQWGAANPGDAWVGEIATAASKYDLLESERVTSGDQLKTLAVEHYKPMMVCSNWAFRPDYQHPTWRMFGQPVWIYKRDTSTSWGHNMTKFDVVKVVGKWYVVVFNSWGPNAHKNGAWFAIPLDLEDDWLPRAEVRTIGDVVQREREDIPFWEIAG